MLGRVARVGQNHYVGFAVVGSITGLLLLLVVLMLRGQRDTVVLQVDPILDPSIVKVYIGGEIASPGLYELPRGSRVLDAVNQAGGLLASADTSGIGLASPLRDADQIIIPPRPATPTPAPVALAQVPTATAGTGSPPTGTAVQEPTSAPVEAGPINVNTANAVDLERLPGIGPVIAGRIIEYRTLHGPFQHVEELAAVAGISDRMVGELRPLVTLGH